MKELLLFIAVGLLVVVGGLAALQAGFLAPVPGLGMILGTSAVLQWWVALRLHRAWKAMSPSQQAANPTFNLMRWLFTLGGIFLTIDIFPHVVLIMAGMDEQTVTIAHWVAHLFLFAYLIIGVRFAVSLFNPKWKNGATSFVVLVSLIALSVSVIRPDYLVHIPGSDLPLLSSDPLFAVFNMISNVTSVGIFGLYLIVMGLMAGNWSVRIRAILMGMGFIALVTSTYLIHYSHSQYTAFLIFISVISWSLFTGISALYAAKWRLS